VGNAERRSTLLGRFPGRSGKRCSWRKSYKSVNGKSGRQRALLQSPWMQFCCSRRPGCFLTLFCDVQKFNEAASSDKTAKRQSGAAKT